MQTNAREEQKDMRERDRHDNEFPAESGPAVEIHRTGGTADFIPNWKPVFALPRPSTPQDFPAVNLMTGNRPTYNQIFNSGGAYCGRMSVKFVVESLRRSVILLRARAEVRRLGPAFTGTWFIPMPQGGDGAGEETEYTYGGVNLGDAPRPTVRALSKEFSESSKSSEERGQKVREALPLGNPFPDQQVTLGPHDQRVILVEAEARQGCYEWRLFLDVLADGEEHTAEVTFPQPFSPFRLTAPADAYSSVLRQEPDGPDNVSVVADTFDNVAFWR